jgi:formate dehydrogenase gamma subunit
MITFIALLMTGMGLLAYNLQGDQGASRRLIVSIHKYISLVFLIAPVVFVVMGSRRIWKENIHLLTTWGWKDIEWLMKKPLKVIFNHLELPPDDKFNPGQKIWATLAVTGSSLLAGTGVIMWVTGSPILALIVHTLVALGLAFALSGHIFMAIGNKDTRPSITSIIDGDVDAQWATHHHPLWMEREARRRVREKAGASATHHHEKPDGAATTKTEIPGMVKAQVIKTLVESKGSIELKKFTGAQTVVTKSAMLKPVALVKPVVESMVIGVGEEPGFTIARVIKIPQNKN